eukprot:TRINITY_DN465_c0_g1_i1.p1 TRINITY_DN465_c0_g1~~TRINITY_DN465_c0_g1_i1.p1  ORF type:complete len:378 (-),score=80.47 TRINITY_DN465_c0_g1_i1:13-1146(-)
MEFLQPSWHLLPFKSSRELNLDLTLNCGQAFRWKKNDRNEFVGVVGKTVYMLKNTDNEILFQFHNSSNNDAQSHQAFLSDYFQIHHSFSDLFEQWCSGDEKFRPQCSKFKGLRLLRQEPSETLFSFICSQNNNISRITKMIDSLCLKFGQKICDLEGSSYYSFPSPQVLAKLEEKQLRDIGFGYRAKYIVQSAQQVIEKGPDWFDNLRKMEREKVQQELIQLMGVGKKVADCIALFSMDKFDIIPVDTHVWQIAQTYIPRLKNAKLNDKTYLEIGDFFRTKFGDQCGWAHTLLFASDLSLYKDKDSGKREKKLPKKVKKEEEDVMDEEDGDVEIEIKTKTKTKKVSKKKENKVKLEVSEETHHRFERITRSKKQKLQ